MTVTHFAGWATGQHLRVDGKRGEFRLVAIVVKGDEVAWLDVVGPVHAQGHARNCGCRTCRRALRCMCRAFRPEHCHPVAP